MTPLHLPLYRSLPFNSTQPLIVTVHSPPLSVLFPPNPKHFPHLSRNRRTPLTISRVFVAGAEGPSHLRREATSTREPPSSSAGIDGPVTRDEVFEKTLRLVECAMLASVAGLTYILSSSLAIEYYFGFLFSLPIVISSMRWGLAAGRKTMVATAMLLLTLAGPVKSATYLLMHGFVGLAMGSLWRLRVNWSLSILLCAFIRALSLVGYVLLSSFLIRENILYLITINIHNTLMGVLAAVGVNTMLTMNTVYAIFTVILVINCGGFMFALHVMYAMFFFKLGFKDSLYVPKWLQRAL